MCDRLFIIGDSNGKIGGVVEVIVRVLWSKQCWGYGKRAKYDAGDSSSCKDVMAVMNREHTNTRTRTQVHTDSRQNTSRMCVKENATQHTRHNLCVSITFHIISYYLTFHSDR